MASLKLKILVGLGYAFFFFVTFTVIKDSIHSETRIFCRGKAFSNSTTFGNGDGKCGIRYNFYSTLLQLDEYDSTVIYGTAEEYQGTWVNGKKDGIGSYYKFSLWNQPNIAPFEGDDKVEYTGEWKQDQRHGRGSFRIHLADRFTKMSWRGEWTEDDLTTSKGQLELHEFRPVPKRRSEKDAFPFSYTVYDGPLSHALMHGTGNLTFGGDLKAPFTASLVDAEFKDGLLQKAPTPLAFKFVPEEEQAKPINGSCSLQIIKNERQNSARTCSFALSCTGTEMGFFEWDGSKLKPSAASTSSVKLQEPLQALMGHLFYFETSFLEFQAYQKTYRFNTFEEGKEDARRKLRK